MSTKSNAALADSESVFLSEYCAERLRTLCDAVGFGEATSAAVDTFRRLISPWADRPFRQGRADLGTPNSQSSTLRIARAPTAGWVSEISDDNTPIELSVTMAEGRAEVRALFETQGALPTIEAHRVSGLVFQERLASEFGADLTRFHLVKDLFLSPGMRGPFAIWNSVVFVPGQAPSFKAYFNPAAEGKARAQALVDEALQRLGMGGAWGALCRAPVRRGPHLDELKYFALDLTADPLARVKVYVRHHNATPEDLEKASSEAKGHVAGQAMEFARAMSGGTERLSARATFTCSAFVEGQVDRPQATTLYVPVCAYARDDALVQARISKHMRGNGVDDSVYNRMLDGFKNRPLDSGIGMQSWAALRRSEGVSRLSVYLSTEAAGVYPPATIPAATDDRMHFESAEQAVACAKSYDLREHPFVQRLLRAPNNAGQIWLLIANTYEGTSKHFIRWLANVTARVEDDRVRCLLARQLDQELGEGDLSRAHTNLMRDFLKAIEPMRPADFADYMLDSGRCLSRDLAKHYLSDDPYEGVAALMAGEICAEQLIGVVAQLLRMQPVPLDPALMGWLTEHDELEANHADESLEMARLLPLEPKAIESVRRGAMGLHSALWQSLDQLCVLCFSK